MRILILAGTAEARDLCRRLAARQDVTVTASLAGRTAKPHDYAVPVRSGGFGGVAGLVQALNRDRIDLLIDATHPFASRISANAVAAAARTGTGIVRLERPEWSPEAADNWSFHANLEDAVMCIPSGARVLAALGGFGRQGKPLDPFENRPDADFLIRSINPYEITSKTSNCRNLQFRPPCTIASERQLLESQEISHLLCRNSGGDRSKLDAAAELRLPVVMISRPEQAYGGAKIFENAHGLASWVTAAAATDAQVQP